jgi:hypothetical protein
MEKLGVKSSAFVLTGGECPAVEWRSAHVANRDDRTTLPLERHFLAFVSRHEAAPGCDRSLRVSANLQLFSLLVCFAILPPKPCGSSA